MEFMNDSGRRDEEFSHRKKMEYRKIQTMMGDMSFILVLPKEYALHLGLRKGEFVKVYEEQNKIFIEKA